MFSCIEDIKRILKNIRFKVNDLDGHLSCVERALLLDDDFRDLMDALKDLTSTTFASSSKLFIPMSNYLMCGQISPSVTTMRAKLISYVG